MIIDLRRLVYLAVFSVIADGADFHQAVSFHHFRATHHVVGRKGRIGVEFALCYGFVGHRLACKRRFVNVEAYRLKQLPVGRNLHAGSQHHDISEYDISFGYHRRITFADHLYGLVVIYLVEYGELLVGFLLEIKCQSCGEEYGGKYAYWFEKNGFTLMQPPVFIA